MQSVITISHATPNLCLLNLCRWEEVRDRKKIQVSETDTDARKTFMALLNKI